MKSVKYKILLVMATLLVLAGCMRPTDKNYHDTLAEMNSSLMASSNNENKLKEESQNLSLPASVSAKMMPSFSSLPGEKENNASLRFDVSVNNVPAEKFFLGLSQGSDTSIVLAPGVSGNISLKLKQVTLLEVLDAVTDLYGYHYEKTSYGYTIYPKALETRIFMINKLGLQRNVQTNTQLNSSNGDLTQASSSASSGGASVPASTVSIQATQKDTFWNDIQTTIASLIGASSSGNNSDSDSPMVKLTEDTGMIVVRAYPKEMQWVERYLEKTANILGREVIIEAEILDVTLTDENSSGIDWNALTAGGKFTPSASTTATQGLLSSVYSLSLSGDQNNFNYALQLLSTQGKIAVLSKPRVSAVNNQSAIIKVGSDDYYVTNVQSQVSTNGSSSASNTTTSTINLQAFFSGISLYVTPQITENGEVNLHIHPSVSKVSQNILIVEVADQNSKLPVAQSQIRETDTIVHAKDGQVIILGGLIQSATSYVKSGLPLSDKYKDGLSALTTSQEDAAIKNELVILLRPLIAHDSVWKVEMEKTAKSAYSQKSEKEFFNHGFEREV